jgi:chemotaxis protein MotB
MSGRKKRHEAEKEPNAERWLLTYADLITLLMIFFVVLYAMSKVEQSKFEALSTSLRFVFGGGGSLIGQQTGTGVIPLPLESESGLDVVLEEYEKYLAQTGVQQEGSPAAIEDRGLVITIQEKLAFEPAKADLTPRAKAQLTVLSKLLNNVNNYVRVEGHSDNSPINTAVVHSNWQLSSLRAANIAEFLVKEGGVMPQRVSAIGYGEYRPIASNSAAAGRARNRRVEIILLNKKFDQTERNAR